MQPTMLLAVGGTKTHAVAAASPAVQHQTLCMCQLQCVEIMQQL
jgi:hypothetical protein